ncbi:MAG: LuxR family transcriptional regulator [Burkholderiales bacterium]
MTNVESTDGEVSMLQGSFQAVLEVRSAEEFRGEVIRFAQHMGFRTVSASTAIERAAGEFDFVTIDNTPENFRERFEAADRRVKDPVMQHCKISGRPIIWDQSTYVQVGLGEHWEEQASFGYREGIAMALHLAGGHHFFLGVDSDGPLTRDNERLTRVVADLQLFTVYAQEAASRVIEIPRRESPEPPLRPLTAREVDALRWTFEGKTAWEVGKILGITERTAVFHVNNAMHKLGCISKHQAAIRADRLGLLS